MYCYLYDAFLREKKYENTLAHIESRLLDLGIQGRSEKLTILKSMKELAETAIKRGADTLIVVGDDQTVSKIIGVVAQHDVVLGVIPMGKSLKIAEYLGVPEGIKACDVLSTRIIEKIDLGKANDAYFLSFLDVDPGEELFLDCEAGKFSIESTNGAQHITVHNFGWLGKDPRDGLLEVVIRPAETTEKDGKFFNKREHIHPTVLSVKQVRMKSFTASLAARADGQTVVKTPLMVEVEPKKLRVIVGRDRKFA